MALLPIVCVPVERLHTLSQTISREQLLSAGTQTFIDNLIETMHHEGGVGIAAVQVGCMERICIVYAQKEEPPEVFVNPVITWYAPQTVESTEGCLSIPGKQGVVRRSKQVKVDAWDRFGQDIQVKANAFRAIVLQHEIDHLNGVLFTDTDRLIRFVP